MVWWRGSRTRWACVLVLGGAVRLLAGSPQAGSASDPIDAAIQRGDYAEAEQRAAARLTEIEQQRGAESPEAEEATELLLDARLRNGRAAAPETLLIAHRLVERRERSLGPQHPSLAAALSLLGRLHAERGDLELALPVHERALSIRRAGRDREPARVADSLDQLGVTLTLLQRFAAAEKALTEARAIRDAQHTPLASARTLYSIAFLHRQDGRYGLALAALERALEIQRTRLPRDHPELRISLQLRGDLHLLQGDAAAARQLWIDALQSAERTLRPQHPDVAYALRRLAVAERVFGDLASARRLLERAWPIGEQGFAECHLERAALVNDLASVLGDAGDYAAARTLYRSALALRERCLGAASEGTATVVHNLALLASKAGDLPDAERLQRQAARMFAAGLGAQHPYVARAYDAIADVVAQRGRFAEARTLYERALAMRTRSLGRDHPEVAWTLTNVAQVLGASGQPTLALGRVQEATAIYQRVGPGDEPDHLARALALRGTLQQQRGDLKGARASFAEALAAREKVFGAAHPLTAESRAAVAASDFLLGASATALDDALEAERVGRDHLRFTVRSLPERQALAYAARRPRGLDLAISTLTTTRTGDVPRVLDAVIRSRSLVLEELAARSQASDAGDAGLAPLTGRVTAARTRFATLMLRSLTGEEPVARAVLDEVRQQKEELERELAERSGAARSEAARAEVGLDDVRRALPAGTALVSYVRYDRLRPPTSAAGARPAPLPSYAAFVVSAAHPDGVVVPIGTASAVDGLVRTWREQTGGATLATSAAGLDAERQVRAAGIRLRRQIWDPIAPSLGAATRVLIVPDGSLNLVSFFALPVEGWRYLVDRGPVMHLVTAERDLVVSDTPASGAGLLAVGGAAYGASPAAAARPSSPPGCGPATLRFEDLPGTLGEVQAIARVWGPASDLTLLSGARATEAAVISGFAGRRVIHLATHGFFLGGPCESRPVPTRSVGGLVLARQNATAVEDNPLLASGLVFAGVNQRRTRDARGDGILTAEEVASLNLRGTEWAVLSACDTGLGEIRAGEGVLGLRRAFQIAGVRTVIMSLWAVGDESARAWMGALYDERFRRGASTADAVHRAHVRTLQMRRAAGQSTHPFYWAAFVAAGDWN